MMNKEDVNVNTIDGNINILKFVFLDINTFWTKEINSNGDCFDYDSQDIYRQCLERLLVLSELVEKLNQESKKHERIYLLEELHKPVKQNILLFKKYKSIFNELPRNRIEFNEYKKRYHANSTKNDEEISDFLIYKKETQKRDEYFSSDLYNNVGFLIHNFHEEIYYYSCYLDDLIKKKFKDYKKHVSTYSVNPNTIFFNMGVVHLIHKNYCELTFEKITEIELYKALNLINTVPYLKRKDAQKMFFIIFKLRGLIENEFRDLWLMGILNEIQVTKKYYTSKYKTVAKSESEDHICFVEQLDTLIDNKLKPLMS